MQLAGDIHFRYLAEFARRELAAGGPDPHMRYVGWMSQRFPVAERFWMAGVYVSVYNTAAAEVIWQEWSLESVLSRGLGLDQWLLANWPGIPLRRERRVVRTPLKLAKCLRSYARYADQIFRKVAATDVYEQSERYEWFWRDTREIFGFGRYARFKLLEFYRRYCELRAELPDIRPTGGWSPRETLALIYPQHAEAIAPKSDKADAIRLSNQLALEVQRRLKIEEELDLDLFLLEVFLCDYKQSIIGKRQYPGRSNDSEMEYRWKVEDWFGSDHPTQLWRAREALTPQECRGEVSGWRNVRKELGTVLADYGYTWSDLVLDYGRTGDLAHPVLRPMDHETLHSRALATLATRT